MTIKMTTLVDAIGTGILDYDIISFNEYRECETVELLVSGGKKLTTISQLSFDNLPYNGFLEVDIVNSVDSYVVLGNDSYYTLLDRGLLA